MALGTLSQPITRYADGHTRLSLLTGYKSIALHLCFPESDARQIFAPFHLAVQPKSLMVCRLSSDQRRRKLDASDQQVRHRCKYFSASHGYAWPVAQSRRGWRALLADTCMQMAHDMMLNRQMHTPTASICRRLPRRRFLWLKLRVLSHRPIMDVLAHCALPLLYDRAGHMRKLYICSEKPLP